MRSVGKVTVLSITPIKGLALHHPHSIELADYGAVGNRQFFLIGDNCELVSFTGMGSLARLSAHFNRKTGHLRIYGVDGEAEARVALGDSVLADFFSFKSVPAREVIGPWSHLLSQVAGRNVRLVMADDAGAGSDVHPVSLLSTASVSACATAGGVASLDPRRFRTLIDIDGPAAHDEDSWAGDVIQVGTAIIRIGGPIQRCAAVTRDPVTGEPDQQVLRWIRSYRGRQESEFGPGLNMGVYARVVQPGIVAVDDDLVVLN